ncbi:MAG: rhomboid family intramembrane serine protease [Bacteroidales bacterium]|nr:rhomboid family intramembrane serine protease [Bacteroidales bacterium]MBN2758393.1 rhomboid family intramembrane serine protease [Bacteroidales bacterium]
MKNSLTTALSIVALLWMILILNSLIPIDFNQFGILPRNINGIKGILFSPFLHMNMAHLISNTIPLFVLLTGLFFFYRKVAVRVLVLSVIIGGSLVWIFGRTAFHIGASGVIFSLIGFLIASGIFRKNIKALLLAIIIFFMYGGVIWGILPTQPYISWEGHLFGFITGILLAYIFKDTK